MNIIFTCGGTGGHINPALALAKMVRERRPNSKILFVGADGGMETELVPREGFEIQTIKITNFQRKLTPVAIGHNVLAGINILRSLSRADQIIREFEPDLIVGTGGYACYPMLTRGAKRNIPTAIHESNAVPGLTTRMVADKVSRIMVSYEESRKYYKMAENVVVTGTPVREEFVYLKKGEARQKIGIKDDKPLVVSYWGSLGAREMNKKIAEFIQYESKGEPFYHIHATGSFGWRWMPEYVKNLGVDLENCKSVEMREYIYDMPAVMAAADLVICRGGASTLGELAAAAKPAIIVPSPNVAENHQEKNARVLEKRGAAMVLLESQCDGRILFEAATDLLNDDGRLQAMKKALFEMAVLDSAERIYATILELYDTQRK